VREQYAGRAGATRSGMMGCESLSRSARGMRSLWRRIRDWCLCASKSVLLSTQQELTALSLIYRTAHELSTHIANSTLSRHISTVLSSIPAHVHLFLMHFGLKTLCREMDNAQQAAYREDLRTNLDMAQPKAKSKKVVGIRAKQPDKEKLEYELLK
jgi:hypothetical protein